jgi:hypothetical protein
VGEISTLVRVQIQPGSKMDWAVNENKPERNRGFEVQISVQHRVDAVSSQPIQKNKSVLKLKYQEEE